LDLTAGLGRDGFVLASLGATVLMLERQPIVFALLEDGLVRARERLLAQTDNSDMGTKGLAEIMNRINTINQDANSYLKNLRADPSVDESCSDAVNPDVIYPDVIYIDPMFPAREKSGKVKKEMQLFHQLVGTDDDSSTLLPLALEVAQYRVVVKRSAHAPFLAEQKPGYSLKGKSTRFDIYPIKKLP
jgi:16S rRNA (guanine1516-N2)-methyltransferase